MTTTSSGPQVVYLVIALVVLALAFAGIVWVGRQIRGELGSGSAGRDGASLSSITEQITPAMMKEAIARGLVVPAQLASMTELERSFLFASIKQKLGAPQGAAHVGPVVEPAVAPQATAKPEPTPPPASPPAPPPRAAEAKQPPALPADLPPAMVALLNAEKLRVWCPMCGTELQLPTFPPMIARCPNCQKKIAVREEDGGRYVINVAPPPK